MVALLKREVSHWLGLLRGLDAPRNYKARPCGDIDYEALCEDVTQRYPKIIQRLGE